MASIYKRFIFIFITQVTNKSLSPFQLLSVITFYLYKYSIINFDLSSEYNFDSVESIIPPKILRFYSSTKVGFPEYAVESVRWYSSKCNQNPFNRRKFNRRRWFAAIAKPYSKIGISSLRNLSHARNTNADCGCIPKALEGLADFNSHKSMYDLCLFPVIHSFPIIFEFSYFLMAVRTVWYSLRENATFLKRVFSFNHLISL